MYIFKKPDFYQSYKYVTSFKPLITYHKSVVPTQNAFLNTVGKSHVTDVCKNCHNYDLFCGTVQQYQLPWFHHHHQSVILVGLILHICKSISITLFCVSLFYEKLLKIVKSSGKS
jgi:hypothetical protein